MSVKLNISVVREIVNEVGQLLTNRLRSLSVLNGTDVDYSVVEDGENAILRLFYSRRVKRREDILFSFNSGTMTLRMSDNVVKSNEFRLDGVDKEWFVRNIKEILKNSLSSKAGRVITVG